MNKQIRKLYVLTNFLRFLNKFWLLHTKISNCEPIQHSIIANIFITLMNYAYGRLNTDMSMDVDSTNIFQFLAFYAHNLIILSPFY